jgi:hypothetical protein
MTARIYRPSPSATQSGPGAAKPWRLNFDPESPRQIDPLMGWTSSGDMRQQIQLRFATKEEAVAFAERNGLPYRIEEPKENRAARRAVSYADNFKTTRIGLWTH